MQAGNIKPVSASETRRSAFDGSGKDQQPQTRTLAPQPTRATAPASPIKKSLVEIVGNYPVEIRYRNCYDPNPENPRHMGYLYIRVLKAEDIATLRSLVGDMSIVFDGKNFSMRPHPRGFRFAEAGFYTTSFKAVGIAKDDVHEILEIRGYDSVATLKRLPGDKYVMTIPVPEEINARTSPGASGVASSRDKEYGPRQSGGTRRHNPTDARPNVHEPLQEMPRPSVQSQVIEAPVVTVPVAETPAAAPAVAPTVEAPAVAPPQPPVPASSGEPLLTSIHGYVIAIYPDGRHLVTNMALGEAPREFTEFERVLFKTLVDLDSYCDKLEAQCKSNTSST